MLAAKVSTHQGIAFGGFKQHVLHVYMRDWQDEREVRRVREVLRSAGFEERLGYKRDGNTAARIERFVYEYRHRPLRRLFYVPYGMNGHRRHDLRSLALHQEAVRVLEEHPERAERALEVLTRWERTTAAHTLPLLREWRRIIEGHLWQLAVEDNDRGQQLRQASPLGFVLDEAVRSEIRQRFHQ